jgi:hypothetical protein
MDEMIDGFVMQKGFRLRQYKLSLLASMFDFTTTKKGHIVIQISSQTTKKSDSETRSSEHEFVANS